MSKSFEMIEAVAGKYGRAAITCSALAIAVATSSATLAQAAPSNAAQTEDNTKLEEIVVTARKVKESIDTVPLSITAMNADKIEARNLKSIDDVASFSPGFYTQQATGAGFGRNDRTFRQLSFRGVGGGSNNLGIRAGGTSFVDGTPVLNSSLANVQDLERVEVLKGPQAAYFGRATFIGAVNYITKDPTDTWTGRVSAEYAEDDLIDVSGSVSGPLADWASIRISGRYFSKDGQYRTSNEQVRLGDQSTKSISATLLLKPTDNLTIRTTANHFVDDDGPSAQYLIGGPNYNPTVANPTPTRVIGGSNCNFGGTGGAYYCGTIPQTADPRLISANLAINPTLFNGLVNNNTAIPENFSVAGFINHFGLKRSAFQFSNRIDYGFGDGGPTLTLVTAYHSDKLATLSDFNGRGGIDPVSGAAIPPISTLYAQNDHDFSQEVRLVSNQDHRFRWLVGGNYIYFYNPSSYVIGYSNFGGPASAGTVANFGALQPGYQKAKTPSAFGAVYFDILPKALTLSLEGRYQVDKISGKYFTSTGYQFPSKDFKSFSPRVSLDYKLTPTSTIYALYSRGTKPGGFNTALLTATTFQIGDLQAAVPTAGITFDEETLDNFETGIKGSFLNGRLRVALDGYIGRYKGAQVAVPVQVLRIPTPPGGLPSPLILTPTINIGNVDLKGVEFEAEAIVFPGFRVGGTFAYTDTKITQYYCTECSAIYPQTAAGIAQGGSRLPGSVNVTVPIGKELPGAPKIAYTLSANYEHRFNSGLTAYLGADYLYRGRYFADAANLADSGNSQLVNARIGVRVHGYNLELFARNLFNDQSPGVTYSTLGTGFAGGNYLRIALPDQRRIGVRANVSF